MFWRHSRAATGEVCFSLQSRSNIQIQHPSSAPGVHGHCNQLRRLSLWSIARHARHTGERCRESGVGWRELFHARMGTLCYQTTTLCYIFSTMIQFSLHDHLDIQAQLLDTESFAGCGWVRFASVLVHQCSIQSALSHVPSVQTAANGLSVGLRDGNFTWILIILSKETQEQKTVGYVWEGENGKSRALILFSYWFNMGWPHWLISRMVQLMTCSSCSKQR